ncbi:MAG: GNAT family N-acetyltransferase, partial [bacterium]|nr:GNAT family N-acetyltransferase [bacterium]
MIHQKEITTDRLHLRAFKMEDADEIRRMAGAKEIAATTANIPHPYDEGMAEQWLGTHKGQLLDETGVVFAIDTLEQPRLAGSVGLELTMNSHRGELGYWIGKNFWGNGFATEAARAVLQYGFEELNLNR